MQLRAVPRYGQNEKFKQLLFDLLLGEPLRWNDELKKYTAKVFTAKQAQTILEAMRTLEGADKDLSDHEVDDSIFDVEKTTITIVPFSVASSWLAADDEQKDDGTEVEVIGICGSTFAFRVMLKTHGFVFRTNLPDEPGVQVWIKKAKDADDLEELEELFAEYGFAVDKYDCVE